MLKSEWVGRRVSVRRVVERAPDGRLLHSDVVGRLAGLDAQTAVIETRAGLVEVPVALITAARVVPPSTADELDLEGVAARGWPAAETEQLDGWLLRADPGGTRRANSVLPLHQLRMPFDEALARVLAFYAARGRPALFQIPTEARRLLDAELAERGWQAEALTSVLVTELRETELRETEGTLAQVEITGEPDDGWLARSAGARADEPHDPAIEPAGYRSLLTRRDGAAFAAVRTGDSLAAIGRASIDRDWLAITSVEVAPGHRRHGLGTAITTALHDWGRARGATRTCVQVLAGNEAGQALYERLGYRHHHDYRYLREPGSS